MTRFIFRGKTVERDTLQHDERFKRSSSPITVAGTGLPERDTVYLFEDDETFTRWTMDVGVEEQVTVVKRRAAEFVKRKPTYSDREDREIWGRNGTFRSSLAEFALQRGESVSSPELVQQWITENPIRQELVDPFVGWDEPNYTGDWIFPCCAAPIMHDWNDRLSSIQMISALGMFCEHWWFGGAKLWLFGLPSWGTPDLSWFIMRPGRSWDNQISSFSLLGG
jgi:hypothetical protein